MKDKQTQPKRQIEAKGMRVEELEAQVGGLLLQRIEMKRRRRRPGGGSSGAACNGIVGCLNVSIL